MRGIDALDGGGVADQHGPRGRRSGGSLLPPRPVGIDVADAGSADHPGGVASSRLPGRRRPPRAGSPGVWCGSCRSLLSAQWRDGRPDPVMGDGSPCGVGAAGAAWTPPRGVPTTRRGRAGDRGLGAAEAGHRAEHQLLVQVGGAAVEARPRRGSRCGPRAPAGPDARARAHRSRARRPRPGPGPGPPSVSMSSWSHTRRCRRRRRPRSCAAGRGCTARTTRRGRRPVGSDVPSGPRGGTAPRVRRPLPICAPATPDLVNGLGDVHGARGPWGHRGPGHGATQGPVDLDRAGVPLEVLHPAQQAGVAGPLRSPGPRRGWGRSRRPGPRAGPPPRLAA